MVVGPCPIDDLEPVNGFLFPLGLKKNLGALFHNFEPVKKADLSKPTS